MILITPLWQTQPWHSQILEMYMKNSVTTTLTKITKEPQLS